MDKNSLDAYHADTRAAVKAFKIGYDAALSEILALVKGGSMTTEEAAACMAGTRLKLMEAEGRKITEYQRESLFKSELHTIESHLPGYRGLVSGRHF